MKKEEILFEKIKDIYLENSEKLLFHGWHHINFVTKKAIEFGIAIDADIFIVKSSALVHDLNYIIRPNSEPEEALEYRKEILLECSYSISEIDRIESVIMEAHTANRGTELSDEGKCLSDADALFKVLPITPVLFAGNYIRQNQVNINKMSKKIVEEQNHLLKNGIYFYTELAKTKYLAWAELNLELWNNINSCMQDEDISEVINIAKDLKVI